MKPLTQEWIEKADGDYLVAAGQWRSEHPVYDAICFHAQQCLEKYPKAWLTEHDIPFPRTHDLEALTSLCLSSLPELAGWIDGLRFLTVFGVEIRYPGTRAASADAQRCWQTAHDVRQVLRQAFGLEG